MKRKDFHVGTSTQGVRTRQAVEEDPWTVKLTTTTLDFRRWQNRMGTNVPAGRDELLKTLATSLQRVSSIRSPKTIEVIFRSSLPALFEFLDTASSSVPRVERITDISHALLKEFLLWLNVRPARTATGRLACSSARSIYTGIRTVLSQCVQAGQLSIDCVPRGAFSGVARSYRPPPPYSEHEMQGLMAALGQDLRKIKAGGFDGTDADRLFIYFLLIAVRTGRNPTALYEMERGAIHPHPLKPDTHSLLTTYKRRGNTTSTQSMRRPRLVEQMSMLNADTSGLIRDVLEFTGDLVQKAPEAIKNRVWLCRRLKRGDLGPVGQFSIHTFMYYAERFVTRHHLIADAASVQSTSALPLHITIMRLRKTFASRMWELTGGDIVATANLLGNQPH
ncbi:integrase, partial [Paraburkholderia strydomiana]|uniref:integrase n=1 Tax=Paraburkholderia strydomiana TaxID=1245417 RepID=UPI0038BB98AB